MFYHQYAKYSIIHYIYSDGQKYVGEQKNEKEQGQGTYTFTDGEKYEGEWKNGEWDGKGTYNFGIIMYLMHSLIIISSLTLSLE